MVGPLRAGADLQGFSDLNQSLRLELPSRELLRQELSLLDPHSLHDLHNIGLSKQEPDLHDPHNPHGRVGQSAQPDGAICTGGRWMRR